MSSHNYHEPSASNQQPPRSHLVCKFGGTSLADADQIRKVEAIVRADERRRYVVVSAPGKRTKSDTKITDMLYYSHRLVTEGRDIGEVFGEVRTRFGAMGTALGVPEQAVAAWLDEVE